MPEWNAYYRNEDDEDGQDEGEEAGGETNSAVAQRSLTTANFVTYFFQNKKVYLKTDKCLLNG